MNKFAFFQAALLLAISALFIHICARGFLDEAMHRRAARYAQSFQQAIPYVADPLATRADHIWRVLVVTCVALTVVSAVCAIAASIWREPGYYLLLLLILVFDVVTPMLL